MARAQVAVWFGFVAALLGCSSGTVAATGADAAVTIPDAVRVVDAPVADAPVADAPVADAPVVDAPVADAHPIDAPPIHIDAPPPVIDAPIGSACGGRGNAPCTGDVYCDWADDSCGASDVGGTCTVRPDVCDRVLSYVCACDGQVYGNACLAAAAGTDVASAGGCPAPPGTFACGTAYCTQGEQLCQKIVGGAIGSPPRYSCQAIPESCAPPTCACLKMSGCGTLCDQDSDGDFTLTCEAP